MKSERYRLPGMDCPTEERIVRGALARVPGITEVLVDLIDRTIEVQHELPDPAPIRTTLEGLNLGLGKEAPPGEDHDHDAPGHAHADEKSAEPAHADEGSEGLPTWALALSGVAAAAAEGAAWWTGDEMSYVVMVLSVVALIAGGRDTLRKGLRAVRVVALNINFLMTLAVVGALAIGQWPEAAMVTFLFALAEKIEAKALDRARDAIKSLLSITPDRALVFRDGAWVDVVATDVKAGRLQAEDITTESLRLRMPSLAVGDPDLVIRTGGEQRISNFLLYGLAYAELVFSERLWPEFEALDLYAAIASYQLRERRFGRVGAASTPVFAA